MLLLILQSFLPSSFSLPSPPPPPPPSFLPPEYPDDPNEEILTSLSRLKFPPTEPSSKDYGQALLKQRQSIQAQGGTRPPSMGQMRGHPPVEALSSDVRGWFLRGGRRLFDCCSLGVDHPKLCSLPAS